jgi:hypothetical protein
VGSTLPRRDRLDHGGTITVPAARAKGRAHIPQSTDATLTYIGADAGGISQPLENPQISRAN